MRKLKQYITNLPFKNKILWVMVLVNIFSVGLVSLVGIPILVNTNNELLYSTIANNLSSSADDIQDALDIVESMTYMMIADDVVQSQLSIVAESEDTMQRAAAYRQLNSSVQTYQTQFRTRYVSAIRLQSGSAEVNARSILYDPLPADVAAELTSAAEAQAGFPVWTTEYSGEHGLFLSRAVRQTENLTMDVIGVIHVAVNIDEMVSDVISRNNRYSDPQYVLFDGAQLVYHSGGITGDMALRVQEQLGDSYEVLKLDGRRYFAVHGYLPDFGWDYVCLIAYDDTYSAMMLAQVLCVLVIVFTAMVSILFSDRLLRKITRHFDGLIAKIKDFSEEETYSFAADDEGSGTMDELGVLHRQFDRMMEEIRTLVQVNYTNKLLVKDAEMKALEAQINPHFLYNVLESINWRAKAIGEKDISQMVESLGKLLREILQQHEELFTLDQELDLVHHYMAIQTIRFADGLRFESHIAGECRGAVLPKLTIQPLLENAIHHGVEENPDGCLVKLEAGVEDGLLVIRVANTGTSFPEDLLDLLKNKTIEAKGLGIGLLNIQKRLQLAFGEEYGLFFTNEGDTAVVRLVVPYQPCAPESADPPPKETP